MEDPSGRRGALSESVGQQRRSGTSGETEQTDERGKVFFFTPDPNPCVCMCVHLQAEGEGADGSAEEAPRGGD